MHASLKIIACIFALLGAVALEGLYSVLLTGFDPASGLLAGLWFLVLAYGLVTFRVGGRRSESTPTRPAGDHVKITEVITPLRLPFRIKPSNSRGRTHPWISVPFGYSLGSSLPSAR